MTFQVIESASLGANLNLKGEALSEFVKTEGWTEASGVITIPVNKDNRPRRRSRQKASSLNARRISLSLLLLFWLKNDCVTNPKNKLFDRSLCFFLLLELTKIIGHSNA